MNEIDVIRDISPNDVMFNKKHPNHYFEVGRSALESIKTALQLSGKKINEIHNILDLPCGYGRVLRFLKYYFPNSTIVACDLDSTAVDFCKETFEAIPAYSSKNIEKISFDTKFDLIWCGSLLTHIEEKNWFPFLQHFDSYLNKNGILVFTTHGEFVVKQIQEGQTYGLESDKIPKLLHDYCTIGFGYSNYKESNEYGISVSSPSFVLHILEKLSDLKLLMYLETRWDEHQDVIIALKISRISKIKNTILRFFSNQNQEKFLPQNPDIH